MSAPPEDVYLTPAELAARWRMTRKQLANWRCEGRGPDFAKFGEGATAPVRYRLSDVIAHETEIINRPNRRAEQEETPCDS